MACNLIRLRPLTGRWPSLAALLDERRASRQLPGWLVVALPALVELVVGGYRISGPSFWRDEAYTITGSQRPASAILAMIPHEDAFHGLYLLLMHPVIAIWGTSETALRLPSLIAMCAAVGLTAALGRRLARRRRCRRAGGRPARRAAAGRASADDQVRAGGQAVCPDRAVRRARDLPAGRGRHPAWLALVGAVCRRRGCHRVVRPGCRAADRGARHQPARGRRAARAGGAAAARPRSGWPDPGVAC